MPPEVKQHAALAAEGTLRATSAGVGVRSGVSRVLRSHSYDVDWDGHLFSAAASQRRFDGGRAYGFVISSSFVITMPNIVVEKQDMLNVIAYILSLKGRDQDQNQN